LSHSDKNGKQNYVKKALQQPAIVNHIWPSPQVWLILSSPNSNIPQEAAPRLCLVPVSVVKQRLRDTRIRLFEPPACRSRVGTSLLL
jgi:hypothetical protein